MENSWDITWYEKHHSILLFESVICNNRHAPNAVSRPGRTGTTLKFEAESLLITLHPPLLLLRLWEQWALLQRPQIKSHQNRFPIKYRFQNAIVWSTPSRVPSLRTRSFCNKKLRLNSALLRRLVFGRFTLRLREYFSKWIVRLSLIESILQHECDK